MSEAAASLLPRLSAEIGDLVEQVLRGVVSLDGAEGERKWSGSGFVIDAEGHVVTNHHVVSGAKAMTATVSGSTSCAAAVLGSDPHTDLAVLLLSVPGGRPLRLRAAPARLGEMCLGVGTPLGVYPESVAFGIVSGLARDIPQTGRRPLEDTIQTDVAINPGNSGGPLVDMTGEVIGVNVCIDSRGQGIGFAIPSETVAHVTAELIAQGRVRRAALGVGVANEMAVNEGKRGARLVVTKVSSGPSEGRLQVGDVIVTLDGHAVRERADLYRLLTLERIGKKIAIEVERDGARHDVEVEPTELAEPTR